MDENRNEDWKMDPKLKNIDAGKLDMLQKLAEKGSGKSASDMLPFLMSAAASGKRTDSISHRMKSQLFLK